MTEKELRKILVSLFGKRNYRITRDNDIHVYGVMPNTNLYGWYLYGYKTKDNTVAR
jgi:hypothetical protein